MIGKKFGNLTVLSKAPNRGRDIMWNCLCDCGNARVVYGANLRRGLSTSCGCMRTKKTIDRLTTHGESETRLFHTWQGMRSRCSNPNHKSYHNYGGRGITVCDAWSVYANFSEWAKANGYQDTLTLDRIDVNGNYTPENCRWVTFKTQNNNRRDNIRITYNGETHTLAEWSDIRHISRQTVWDRYQSGRTPEEILCPHRLKTRKEV